MEDFRIAAQLFTLREFLKTPEDINASLKKVKRMGYTAVQVSAVGPIEPQKLKDITDELGLTICVTHTPIDRLRNDLKKVIEEHKLWNCNYIGLGSMPQEFRTSKEGVMTFLNEFNKIAKEIKEGGLKFVYHNHRFEFAKFNQKTIMDIIMEETDPESYEFELDTYWVQAGGANPVEWIRKVDGRMGVVHLKDMAIVDNEQVFCEIGEGNLNFTEILKACKETAVKWAAVEQDRCYGKNPFDCLETSYINLQKLLGKKDI